MEDKQDVTGEVFGGIAVIVVIILIILGVRAIFHSAHNRPTTYCTAWTRAVSITPTNHDNGKYSDEQYVVKYEDGSIDGQDQGQIPYARCTNKIRTASSPNPDWKVVDTFGDVDWDQ